MSRISKIRRHAERRRQDVRSRKIKHAMKMLQAPKPVTLDKNLLLTTPKRRAADEEVD